jgi:hypothetical protein
MRMKGVAMSQELKEIGVKRCYACIQWDGQRTFYPEKKQIKVDVGSMGTCLVTHTKIKGSGHCDQFFPLR